MQFAYPSVLWALSLLAIPIAIHLFHLRRYKTVYFSDLRFLKEVQQNTNRQRRLKEWLVLLSRLLMITALVLAFAKPFLPSDQANVVKAQSIIYLDNSASTQAGIEAYSPFERGKQLALELVNNLPAQNQVALLTASSIGNPTFKAVAETREEIQNTQPVDRDAANLQAANPKKWEGSTVYVISDMQRSGFDLTALKEDSAQFVLLPTINETETNLANAVIDSVWLEAPFLMAGQPVNLFCRIKQFGNAEADVTVEISLNNLPEITLSAHLKPNSDTILASNVTQLKSGFNHLQIALVNDAVRFDNIHSRIYYVPMANRVVEVYQDQPSALIANLFGSAEFEFTAMPANQANNIALEEADLIILNGVSQMSSGLQNQLATRAGQTNFLLIPNPRSNGSNNDLATRLGINQFGALDTAKLASQRANTNDPFFEDVFSGSLDKVYWPTAKKHFRLSGVAILPAFKLMTLANGDDFFVRYASGQANIFQLTVPLDEGFTDLAKHPVIVPILIKSLMKSNSISGYTGTIGTDQRFDFKLNTVQESPAEMRKGGYEVIPQQQVFGTRLSIVAGTELTKAGIYTVVDHGDTLGKLAFTIPISESNLSRFSAEELADWIDENNATNLRVLQADSASLGVTFKAWQQGVQLWRWALGLALLLIIVEVILLKYLK
jgi:hypothetical protein